MSESSCILDKSCSLSQETEVSYLFRSSLGKRYNSCFTLQTVHMSVMYPVMSRKQLVRYCMSLTFPE